MKKGYGNIAKTIWGAKLYKQYRKVNRLIF